MIHHVNTKNKNIQIGYEQGKVKWYVTKATEDLKIPSLGFSTEEDAEHTTDCADEIDNGQPCRITVNSTRNE